MDTLTAIKARFSYRGDYDPTPVSRQDLKLIMEAGLAAPSGCNTQTTSLIAVDDPELLGSLTALLHKPKFEAPTAICVLAEPVIAYDNTRFHVQDYSAAIENMLLAITAMGYASCWVEGYVTGSSGIGPKMAKLLGVPETHQLVAYLPVGRPIEENKRVKKKPFEERAWFNGYGRV